MVEIIVSLTRRSARVWMHFNFKRDSLGKIDKSKHAICKICNALVAHGGGMTNLRTKSPSPESLFKIFANLSSRGK